MASVSSSPQRETAPKTVGKHSFICFIGMDGSGKSTQAQALVKALEAGGHRSRWVRNRFDPILTRPFMWLGKALFFGGKGKLEDYKGYATNRKRVFRNPAFRLFYSYALLLDYYCQLSVRVCLPLMFRQSIVCDRYIYDTVVDLAVELNYSRERTSKVLRRLLYLLPKPDLVFLMDVPEEIAYRRKDDIPSIDFLKERREVYLYIAREQGMAILDGSRDRQELEAMVQEMAGRVIE